MSQIGEGRIGDANFCNERVLYTRQTPAGELFLFKISANPSGLQMDTDQIKFAVRAPGSRRSWPRA